MGLLSFCCCCFLFFVVVVVFGGGGQTKTFLLITYADDVKREVDSDASGE